MTTPVENKIRDQLEKLIAANQQHVLDYVEQLLLAQSGHPASRLLRYAGLIPPEELDRIARAIQEDEDRLTANE